MNTVTEASLTFEDIASASDVPALEQPHSSVIIVNFNGGDALLACLQSVLCQHQGEGEIILVDNASTDDSIERAERMYHQVRVLRSDVNLGFGGGNNLGARHATGKYLAFLNPDTLVAPGWLESLIAAMEQDASIGLATSRIMLLGDRDHINTCGNDVHYTGLTLCRGMGHSGDSLADVEEVGAASGAAFVMRRELFEALGGFDDSFFLYMEDTDLSIRVRLTGQRCIYVPDSVVFHEYTLRFGPQKVFYQERNRYVMLLKGLEWRTLVALTPALVLAEAVTWGFVLLKHPHRVTSKLRAYGWIVRHWPEIMSQRRLVQSMRQVSDRSLLSSCTHRLAYEQTDTGRIATIAHRTLDPLFLVFKRLALIATR